VGDGAVLPKLKEQAQSSGLTGRMRFTGAVPHNKALHYIGAMDITVMPHSNWYGSPVKVFEYGAMGKPVVAPRLIPLTDVIDDGVTGYLFDEGDLLSALERAIVDRASSESIGNALKSKVFSQHTWRDNAKSVLHSVRKVL
jgi:glycosyltransferase involved in cell wall biosynthesis